MRVMYCCDCQESYDVDISDKFCLVCGAEMCERDTTPVTVEPAPPQQEENRLATLLDIFGVDLRGVLEASLSSSNQTSISTEFASSLGKVTVDSRKGILWNCVITLGPLKINAVSSAFGTLPFDGICSAPLMISIPEYGEGALVNAGDMMDTIVLMKRGCITFAEKAIRAAEAGAACLIVMQSGDRWPFVMTDSANQIGGDGLLGIPAVMVSNSDGELLQKLMKSGNAHTKNVSIQCTEGSKDCIICHEEFSEGEVVLKLPCAHTYHDSCVMSWLEAHHTCPMCRHEMPAAIPGTAPPPRRQDVHEDAEPRQSYFV